MIRLKENSIQYLITIPIYIGLIFTMLINGWNLLTGGETVFLKYLSIYNSLPLENYPSYFMILFYLIGVVQVVVALILAYALSKREFLGKRPSTNLKWGLILAIFSVSIFGFMVRIVSNHSGAANLYFYMTLLFFLLWYVEKQSLDNDLSIFNRVKLLPIYFSVFYTMGFPGWQKIVNTSEVMGKYVKMFSESFLAKLPGGIEPLIYFLGAMEIAVTIILILSLVKMEFWHMTRFSRLNTALLISIVTFIMLSFGLSILVNYPGSANLILYSISTFGLYLYITQQTKEIK